MLYNQIVVLIARDKKNVPLINLWRALEPLENRGIGGDGYHLNGLLTGAGDFASEANLGRGQPLRNLVQRCRRSTWCGAPRRGNEAVRGAAAVIVETSPPAPLQSSWRGEKSTINAIRRGVSQYAPVEQLKGQKRAEQAPPLREARTSPVNQNEGADLRPRLLYRHVKGAYASPAALRSVSALSVCSQGTSRSSRPK